MGVVCLRISKSDRHTFGTLGRGRDSRLGRGPGAGPPVQTGQGPAHSFEHCPRGSLVHKLLQSHPLHARSPQLGHTIPSMEAVHLRTCHPSLHCVHPDVDSALSEYRSIPRLEKTSERDRAGEREQRVSERERHKKRGGERERGRNLAHSLSPGF